MNVDESADWFEVEQLHVAAMDGDTARCEQLIASGRDPNAFDELGNTPLHYAAASNRLDVAKLLLAHGANVNAHHEPSIGNTPLADVAQTCSLEMAELLVNAGADPTIRGWMQLNALDHAKARKRGDGPKVYALLRNAAGQRTR
jgi:ankyrin repeat protein